jgi:hypothetical protein
VEFLQTVIVGVTSLCDINKALTKGDRAKADLLESMVAKSWLPRNVPTVKQPRFPQPSAAFRPTLGSGE